MGIRSAKKPLGAQLRTVCGSLTVCFAVLVAGTGLARGEDAGSYQTAAVDDANSVLSSDDWPVSSVTGSAIDISWPVVETLDPSYGEPVTFPTRNPFTLTHWLLGIEIGEPHVAQARLFVPESATAEAPVPAVVLMHGAGGVLPAREIAYARQLMASGIAAIVVDSFGSRSEFTGNLYAARIFRTTEMMMVADAYAALDYLSVVEGIDESRVALMGFSYGGITSMIAAQAQVAEVAMADEDRRFVAHIAYYGPCIARFADRRTTGAPVLFLMGGRDALVDPERCEDVAEDLRAGGSPVRTVFYEDAYHQWDGGLVGPRRIGYNIAPCDMRIGPDGVVWDGRTGLPMTGPITRLAILMSCTTTEGFLVGRDDEVRHQSNAEVARVLESVFNHPGRDPWSDHAGSVVTETPIR